MKQLDKLTSEAMAQSINEPSLFENFSNSFKSNLAKLGNAAVFGMLALGITGMTTEVHAMDSQAFAVATGVTGLVAMANNGSIPNNLPPECANIQGKNGWVITSGGTSGALLGSNIGKGNGTKWATVAGTLLGAGIANGVEEQRIQRECQAIIARNQQQIQQMQQQYRTPQYNQNVATPTADILYQANTINGQNFFVTVENSPGILALTGNRQGIINPHTSPIIYNGIKQSLENLSNAYAHLDSISKKYLNIINGTEEEIFNPNPETNYNYRNNTQIFQLKSEYERAYNTYAVKRGIAAHILDEASARNYNLNEFSEAISLFQVPQSAKVTYSSVYQKPFENRYANDIKVSSIGIR
jgi:uncharacterized protein YcfJ